MLRAWTWPLLLTAVACAHNPAADPDASDAGLPSTDAVVSDALPSADAPGADAVPDAALDAGSLDAAAEDASPAPDAMTNPDAAPRPLHAYVGSSDGNIYRFSVARDGTLTARGPTPAGTNPSFLAFDGRGHLYAAEEAYPMGAVRGFGLDLSSGELSALNRVSSEGAGPAHLSVTPDGQFVLVANYGDGVIASIPIAPTGRLLPAVDREQAGANAHQILTDPSGGFALVPCLGAQYVAQYALDRTRGLLTPNAVPTVLSRPGAGPRHLAFHPGGRFAYVINELDSTVTAHDFDPANGQLTPRDTVSTLPDGFRGNNTCAEVFVHPSGRFLYGSNRGHDSIVRFAIDPQDGHLTRLGHTATGGRTPRNFGLSPDGTLMIVANQDSGSLRVFGVDAATGELSPLGPATAVPRPAFVGLVELR